MSHYTSRTTISRNPLIFFIKKLFTLAVYLSEGPESLQALKKKKKNMLRITVI